MNVPVQMEAVRRARLARVRAASASSGLTGCAGKSSVPATSAIASGPLSLAAASTPNRIPVEETTFWPSAEYSMTS